MIAAKRNLMIALLQERLDFMDIVRIQEQLALGLCHMHAKGKLHADFKPLNLVRMDDGTWRLIDFDATVEIGNPVGAKTSSAYCPPEMVTYAQRSEELSNDVPKAIKSQDAYRENQDNRDASPSDVTLRRFQGDKETRRRVNDKYQDIKDMRYDLLLAEPCQRRASALAALQAARKPLATCWEAGGREELLGGKSS